MTLAHRLAQAGTSRRTFLTGLGVALAGGATRGEASPTSSTSGSSSRESRRDATSELPWDHLASADRRRIATVVDRASLFRRMPTQLVDCDPEMFSFLTANPDVVVDLWRVLGISDVQLRRRSPRLFETNDGHGTSGTLEVVHHDAHRLVALGKGYYEGSMFSRRLSGQCVMLLQSQSFRDAGRSRISSRLDAFIDIENVGAELVARTFQPVVGHFADHNFRETSRFISTLHRAAETNPERIEQLADRMDGVDVETRQEFVELSHTLAARLASAEEKVELGSPELARRPRTSTPPGTM